MPKNINIKSIKNIAQNNISFMFLLVIYIESMVLPKFLFKSESVFFYKWYLALLLIGALYLPLSNLIFFEFKDKGYIFSKTIGITISSLTFFWLSTLKLAKFTSTNCFFAMLLIAVISIFVLFLNHKKENKKKWDKYNLRYIAIEEIVFLLLLIALMYLKAFNPSANTTEKYMDYGFMRSMFNTTYFPVEDVWFSGTNLNYYYIGQYVATFLTKLSFNQVEYSHNLMLMTIAAIASVQVFSIVYHLLSTKLDKDIDDGLSKKKRNALKVIGGIISAIAVCFMGNLHYVIFYFIIPLIEKITNIELASYWFPNSTRYIGYNPERADKTIHEFPSYSFILGDLHAHVINIIFVLTIIGILTAFALHLANQKEQNKLKDIFAINKDNATIKNKIYCYIVKPITPTVLLCGIFIGLFQGTNFWDFPIYLMVTILSLFFVNSKAYGFNKKSTIYSIIQIVYVTLISKIVILPFTLYFVKMESGIRIAQNHTLFYQLLVLWAYPTLYTLIGILCSVNEYVGKNKKDKSDKNTSKKQNIFVHITQFISNTNISDLYAMLLSCCAIGLVIIPEIIYVKDIYGEEYARSNTMFKLTYQSFIMFGIALGYYITLLLFYKRTKIKQAFGTLFFSLFVLCSCYFFTGSKQWFGEYWSKENYKSLNSLYFIYNDVQFADDANMINFINKNYGGMPTILEAAGYSYTAYERMSMATGKPTVIGWYTHEWLWKNDMTGVAERRKDVETIYTSKNVNEISSLLKKYDVDFVYIGNLEYDLYETTNTDISVDELLSLGKVVATKKSSKYPNKNIYLIKVNGSSYY